MNHAAALLASTLAAGALVGCAIDPAPAPEVTSTAGLSFEDYKAHALYMPESGRYVVEWDLVFDSEAELRDYWQRIQPGALLLYTLNGVDQKWNATQKKQLSYCVSNGFGANKTAMVQAMAGATEGGWEKYGDVNFTYVPAEDANCTNANNNVMFNVIPAPAGAQYLASAFFPNEPRAGRVVDFATASFDPQQTGGISVTNIAIHELGHVLGFRHEHIRIAQPNRPNCLEGTDYRDVTPYDVTSTMHYPQCGSPGNTLALSARDQQGVALIYGAAVGGGGGNAKPTASFTAPTDGATMGPSFTVKAAIADTDLASVELYIDSALKQTLTAAPFDFEVTGLAAGSHSLEVRAKDQAGQITTATITVSVTGSGTGNNTGNNNGSANNNGGGSDADVTGGCSAGGSGAGLVLGFGALGLVLRRRRRR
jgi:uncharacterized protein (TIGR03382 family)